MPLALSPSPLSSSLGRATADGASVSYLRPPSTADRRCDASIDLSSSSPSIPVHGTPNLEATTPSPDVPVLVLGLLLFSPSLPWPQRRRRSWTGAPDLLLIGEGNPNLSWLFGSGLICSWSTYSLASVCHVLSWSMRNQCVPTPSPRQVGDETSAPDQLLTTTSSLHPTQGN
jgi:hypothetical protein